MPSSSMAGEDGQRVRQRQRRSASASRATVSASSSTRVGADVASADHQIEQSRVARGERRIPRHATEIETGQQRRLVGGGMGRPVEPDAHLLVQRLHQRDLAVLVAGPELRLEPSQRRILRPLGQPVQQLHRLGEQRDVVASRGSVPTRPGAGRPGPAGRRRHRRPGRAASGRDRLVCLWRIAEPGGVQACELVGHPFQRLRRSRPGAARSSDDSTCANGSGPVTAGSAIGVSTLASTARPRTRVPRPASTSAWACDRVDDRRHHASARGGVQRSAQGCVVLDDDQVMAATALPHSALDEPHRACRVVAAGVGLDDHRRPGRRVCEQSLDQRRQHLGVGPAVPGGALRAVDQQCGRLPQRSQRAARE